MHRLREAIQFCKSENEMDHVMTDHEMDATARMSMESCLIKNYLLKHGMNYFGKRDLIYIDMQGDKDVARMGPPDRYFTMPDLRPQ